MAEVTPRAARPLVYLAGPFSQPDPLHNTHRAIEAAECLLSEGLCTPFVPHLTALWHIVKPHPIDFWYEYDLVLLERCDAVLRLPGESIGADREVRHAIEIGLPVFHEVAVLHSWCRTQATQTDAPVAAIGPAGTTGGP